MAEYVVDSSILVAIIKREAEASAFDRLLGQGGWAIGWPSVFETRIWTIRKRLQAADMIGAILEAGCPLLVAFDGDLEAMAAGAFARFGKGQHPAKLNFGDCMAYAVAKQLGLPLLFKGGDFGLTDIDIHPASAIAA